MKNITYSASVATRRTAPKSPKQAVASTRSSAESTALAFGASGVNAPLAAKKSSAARPAVAPEKGAARARKAQGETREAGAPTRQSASAPGAAATPRRVRQATLATRVEKVPVAKKLNAKVATAKNEGAPQAATKIRATSKVTARVSQEKLPAKARTPAQKAVAKKMRDAIAPGRASESFGRTATGKLSKAAPAPSPESATPIKAKRAKLPADFAAQYTRATKTRTPLAPLTGPKKRARRSAAERENLRRAMTPDDDFLRRLARAGAIASSAEMPAMRRSSTPRRSRKWESRCGKCGTNSTFSTPASLCARCGTIVVRAE